LPLIAKETEVVKLSSVFSFYRKNLSLVCLYWWCSKYHIYKDYKINCWLVPWHHHSLLCTLLRQ